MGSTFKMYWLNVGCPTSYSCHEVSGTFIFEIRIGPERIQSFQMRIFSDEYPFITRRTWHFRIYFEDIREYLVSGNSILSSMKAVLAQAMGHKASSKPKLTVKFVEATQ